MSLLNSILSFPFIRRLSDIELFKKYPEEVQAEMFRYLVDKAADTDWGKTHNFKDINSTKDLAAALRLFRLQVPLSSYDDLKPWIDRSRQGEIGVLWPGTVKWFAKSSGTTNDKSKFIPVTEDSLEECHYQGGKDTIALYVDRHPETKLFTGKTLSLGGSKREDELNSDNYCGDLSAILMDNLPFWAEFGRTPELPVALMDEWESKLKEIIRTTKSENVVALAGVPSWMLVLLRKLISESGVSSIRDLWPNLELFMHGGVAFGPYQSQYKKICGPNMNYVNIYNASEGFFGIGCDSSRDDMLLMLDYGVFYEFVPLEELEKDQPQAYTISEVELDRNYALIISTSGGLWRYIIGDTIQFTNLKPYYFKISGRTKHFINVFGEELMVDNADQAIAIASERTGALVKEFSAAPVFMTETEKGRHEWLIEFEHEPDDLAHFNKSLDEALKSLNSDYEAKRYKDLTLLAPDIVVARPGLFYDWLANKNKLGGQHKVPRLSNNRTQIEEMLKFSNV
ncbi:MAG: GH3 auxin-responsive promoter family protein [Candidatus Falkowbacteria bacterium]